jgi:hypothetical protein
MIGTVGLALARRNWNRAFFAFCFGVFCQAVVLPCMCMIGDTKMRIAMACDVLIAGRIFFGWNRSERGWGWLFYAALPFILIPLIEGVVSLYVRHHA